MTIIQVGLVLLLVLVVMITMKKAITINLSDIEKIELDEIDRDNIN